MKVGNKTRYIFLKNCQLPEAEVARIFKPKDLGYESGKNRTDENKLNLLPFEKC